ncbi:YceI family protein [Naumannella sp. ID2617S]|nr:YceI family protein [Naumannella sp. ID2617S]
MSTQTRELTPADGELLVRTGCEGAMARMGHDLTLAVGRWRATLGLAEAAADCTLSATADLDSLSVRDSAGGAKEVSASDRKTIERNAAGSLGGGRLTFTATEITGGLDRGTVRGEATLNGVTRPLELAVERTGDGYRLTGTIVQSQFRIKPYSAMMGALKVADAVQIEATVRL